MIQDCPKHMIQDCPKHMERYSENYPCSGCVEEAADLSKCPGCRGEADNGHDRCVPPNPYYCTKCADMPVRHFLEDAAARETEESGRNPEGKTSSTNSNEVLPSAMVALQMVRYAVPGSLLSPGGVLDKCFRSIDTLLNTRTAEAAQKPNRKYTLAELLKDIKPEDVELVDICPTCDSTVAASEVKDTPTMPPDIKESVEYMKVFWRYNDATTEAHVKNLISAAEYCERAVAEASSLNQRCNGLEKALKEVKRKNSERAREIERLRAEEGWRP